MSESVPQYDFRDAKTPIVPISSFFHDDAGPHLVRPGVRQPSGTSLSALLDAGISGLSSLEPAYETPVAEELVPIEALLYRGRAALQRAIELSSGLRARGATPDAAAFAELHDLLHLATSE